MRARLRRDLPYARDSSRVTRSFGLSCSSRSSRRRPWPMPDVLGSDGMREKSTSYAGVGRDFIREERAAGRPCLGACDCGLLSKLGASLCSMRSPFYVAPASIGGMWYERGRTSQESRGEQLVGHSSRRVLRFRREIDAQAGVSDGIPYEMGLRAPFLTPEQGFRSHLPRKGAPPGASGNKIGPHRGGALLNAMSFSPTGCAYGSTGTPSSRR